MEAIEDTGLQNTLVRSGPQNTLVRSGLLNTLESSGLQNALEMSVLQNTVERSGLKDTLENSGFQNTLQYVELGGVVGVFIKLDAANIDEERVEAILKTAQNQIKVMVQAFKDGSIVQRDIYVRASDRNKKGKGCSCKYCDESFYCRLDLVAHQSKHHPNLPVRSGRKSVKPCPTCGRLVHNLSLHLKMKHSDLVVYNGGLAYCKQCEQTYPMDSDHTSVCRFSPRCPECKKTFSQWRGMIKHRKVVHMGEKIECPTCKKTFHDTQSLKKHSEAVHMKLKRVCPLCGATVTCLSTHMNAVHADVRNFACDMCDKKFKSKYDLTRHRDGVHLGHKAACPLCGKHISNLNQHIRVVHKQIKFSCNMCTKKYNTKSELEKHLKLVHSLPDGGINSVPSTLYTQKYDTELQPAEQPLQPENIGFPKDPAHHINTSDVKNEVGPRYIRSSVEPAPLPVTVTVPDDHLISQYMEKHQFSNTPNGPFKQESSLNESVIDSNQEQIILKQGLEFQPNISTSSRTETRFIELRTTAEARQLESSYQGQNNRLIPPDDRMQHSGLDDQSYHISQNDRLQPSSSLGDRSHHRLVQQGDERLRNHQFDHLGENVRLHKHLEPPGDSRLKQYHKQQVDNRLDTHNDHLGDGRQYQQLIEDGHQENNDRLHHHLIEDDHEHLHHQVEPNVGIDREVDLSSYSLRGGSNYYLSIRTAGNSRPPDEGGRAYDQPEHQQDDQHYNPH